MVIEQMFDTLDALATSFPTTSSGSSARTARTDRALVVSPDGLTPADLDAEDRLIDELLESGVLEPDPNEPVVLPPNLETWPADGRLAVLLDHVDPADLSDADRIRYVTAGERLTSHTQAVGIAGIHRVADSYRSLDLGDPKDVHDGTTFELRAALRWTRRHAEAELDLATDLHARVPSVLQALRAGHIDKRRAKTIVDGVAHLQSIAHARQVADEVLGGAGRLTTGQLAVRVRRACVAVDSDSVRRQLARGTAERRFMTWSEPDGTMTVQVSGVDPLRGQELSDRINRMARQLSAGGESRSIDQIRADVAVDLLTGTSSPTVGRVHLTVDLATLARLADTPGDLAGYGPVVTDITRQVLDTGDGSWEWTVTHPDTQRALADGHTRRRHTTSQARRVRARHETCVAPGCRMPAVDCDLDHTTPYAESGITDGADSAPLCRHDHGVRHRSGWAYRHLDDGDILWTSPTGTRYTASGRDP
ncbi:MAG TPA: DUF222 domain-containing protein [Acidimicrobiia bacterium]|nr:DUF222 domain-containing protein [Acidimicrobiia bacterium]